jgi:hypothetical protein
LEDGLGGGLLEVGWVAVLAEDAFDDDAHFGADAFFDGPVDGGVAADGFVEFVGDEGELFVSEDFDGAAVVGEGVVEGEFVFGEACCSPRSLALRISVARVISSSITSAVLRARFW